MCAGTYPVIASMHIGQYGLTQAQENGGGSRRVSAGMADLHDVVQHRKTEQ